MSGDIDIVERLRLYAAAEAIHAPLNGGGFGVMQEAADAIEDLTAERDASRLIINDLTAEVERLRAAGDRAYEAINAVVCGWPRNEMAELAAAYIDWEARRG